MTGCCHASPYRIDRVLSTENPTFRALATPAVAGGTIAGMTDPALPVETAPADALSSGRDALARHAWQDAFDLLSRADSEGTLAGADLESLAEAAFFSGHAARQFDINERAFKAHLVAGDEIRAAYLALELAHDYGYAGKLSIASAWGRRGERLLDGKPETYANGYLALRMSQRAVFTGEIEAALALAEQAVEIAGRMSHADLQAAALTNLGTLKIATGAASEGMAMMEEASIAAVNGELSPFATGATCCQMISACRPCRRLRQGRSTLPPSWPCLPTPRRSRS